LTQATIASKLIRGLMVSTVYRRKQESEIWHFCSNCSQWPEDHYLEQRQAPGTGEMCNECTVKRREGNCG